MQSPFSLIVKPSFLHVENTSSTASEAISTGEPPLTILFFALDKICAFDVSQCFIKVYNIFIKIFRIKIINGCVVLMLLGFLLIIRTRGSNYLSHLKKSYKFSLFSIHQFSIILIWYVQDKRAHCS